MENGQTVFHIPKRPIPTTWNKVEGDLRGDRGFSIYPQPIPALYEPRPMTFGGSLYEMGRGLAGGAGQTVRALTVGGNGGRGVLGNLVANVPAYAWNMARGRTGVGEAVQGLGQDLTMPFRRLAPEFGTNFDRVGMPGQLMANKAYEVGITPGQVGRTLQHWIDAPMSH